MQQRYEQFKAIDVAQVFTFNCDSHHQFLMSAKYIFFVKKHGKYMPKDSVVK